MLWHCCWNIISSLAGGCLRNDLLDKQRYELSCPEKWKIDKLVCVRVCWSTHGRTRLCVCVCFCVCVPDYVCVCVCV